MYIYIHLYQIYIYIYIFIYILHKKQQNKHIKKPIQTFKEMTIYINRSKHTHTNNTQHRNRRWIYFWTQKMADNPASEYSTIALESPAILRCHRIQIKKHCTLSMFTWHASMI